MDTFPWTFEPDFPLAEIIVPTYQRNRDLVRRAESIAERFSWEQFDPIKLNRRKDGSFSCTDGLSRIVGFENMGCATIPAMVMSTTYEGEVTAFIEQGKNRKTLKAFEIFNGQVDRGDALEVAINDVVRECGHAIGQTNVGHIEAVASLRRIYRSTGPEGLAGVIDFVDTAWKGDGRRMQGNFLEGVSLLLAEYGHLLTPERVDCISDESVKEILRNAETTRGQDTTKAAKLVAGRLRKLAGWNKNSQRGW